MNRILVSLFAFAFAVSAQAAHYSIDDSHSHVGFTIKHLVSHVKGEFKEFTGSFDFDPAKPEETKGSFSAKTASISTNNAKRDEHLRGADFFDAKKYPEISLTNLKVSKKDDTKYEATGDFSMHGVTKPVTFDVEFGGTATDPWGGHRAGFNAAAKISRKDFGIVWNKTLEAGGLLLGEDVMLDLQVEAVEAKPSDASKESQNSKDAKNSAKGHKKK